MTHSQLKSSRSNTHSSNFLPLGPPPLLSFGGHVWSELLAGYSPLTASYFLLPISYYLLHSSFFLLLTRPSTLPENTSPHSSHSATLTPLTRELVCSSNAAGEKSS